MISFSNQYPTKFRWRRLLCVCVCVASGMLLGHSLIAEDSKSAVKTNTAKPNTAKAATVKSATVKSATVTPATVADAVKALDLATFPAMTDAKDLQRSVARLSYNVASDVKAAYEFQRKTLVGVKWTEMPDKSVTDQSASGMFTKDGFVVSVTIFDSGNPQQKGMVNASVILHGNVSLKKLPLPGTCKPTYEGPTVAMYVTEAPVAKTSEECRKLLMAQGWQPYGTAGDVQFFKQNAIRLTVSVASAPAQAGKTSISFSAEQLSADLPAPAKTVQLQYSDATKQILFDTKDNADAIVDFYRTTLDKTDWKATTDKAFKIGFRDTLIFRNPAKDLLTLETYFVKEQNVLRVILKHESAAEVAAMEKRLDEQAAAKKKKADTPLPKIEIVLPKGAELTEETKTRLEFTVASGKTKAAADSLRKAFRDAGWKEEVLTADAMIGELSFKKDGQEISLSYVDTGIMPAEFTIKGSRVELERAKANKD